MGNKHIYKHSFEEIWKSVLFSLINVNYFETDTGMNDHTIKTDYTPLSAQIFGALNAKSNNRFIVCLCCNGGNAKIAIFMHYCGF